VAGWADAQLKKSPRHWRRLKARSARLANNPTISGSLPSAALGYLDFRFAELNWRASHPLTAAWFAL
jgi:glutathione S-transferase